MNLAKNRRVFAACGPMVLILAGFGGVLRPALAARAQVAPAPAQTPPAQPPTRAPATRPEQSPLGPPPIQINPSELDLGTLRPNERTSGTVNITNIGEQWLKILASKADCTCTSVNLANVLLAPGESVPLQADYQASSTVGPKKAEIRVWFEGYDVFKVPIRALVSLPVEANPTFIDALGEKKSGTYVVASKDQQPFRILAVNGEPPAFIDFNPLADSPRNRYEVKWDLTGYSAETCRDAQNRPMPGWIVVETDHPDCPIFDLEIRNKCVRRPAPQPTDTWILKEKRVLLGGLTPGAPVEFDVEVKTRGGGRMTDDVKTVLAESAQFKAEFLSMTPIVDGARCRLRVTPAEGHRGLIYGTLRVYSSHQSAPLTVIATVRE